jgi:phage-related protein
MPSVGKHLQWIGSSYKDLSSMPDEVQDTFGYALHLAQEGGTHANAKSFTQVGGGVMEVVEDHQGNTYRAMYTAKLPDAVYVLHCFQKKSKSGIATPKPDVALIEQRLKVAQVQSKVAMRKAAKQSRSSS